MVDNSMLTSGSLSDIGSVNGDQTFKQAGRIQVLNTMMKILSCLKTISSEQIERSYKMAVEDNGQKLRGDPKYFLFQQLMKMKSIVKIVFLQEDQSQDLKSPVALVKNLKDELIISRWSLYPEDRKDYEILSSSMKKEKAKSISVLYLEKGEVGSEENRESVSSVVQSPRILNIHPEYKSQSQSQTQFLAERVGTSSQPKVNYFAGYVQNTQPYQQQQPVYAWSQSSGRADLARNNPLQTRIQRESSQERGARRVYQELGSTKLHSEKLLADYGLITYRELFQRLCSNPDSAKNAKWIGYFRQAFSESWSHPCLQTLRKYFIKYD